MTTLAEELKKQSVDPRALISVQPRAKIEGFSLTSGKTYTYESLWSERAPVKVSEDGTELTEKTSVADVESNAGSWHWSAGDEKLYVHTTGGDAPSGHLITLEAIYRFCSQNGGSLEWDGHVWEPLINEGGAPRINFNLPNIFFDEGKFNTISFTLINSDGWFDRISRLFIWENAIVKVWYGVAGLSFTGFNIAFIGFLQSPPWGLDTMSFGVVDLRSLLNEEIPKAEYAKAEYPALDEADEGKDIPIFYGPWNDAPCTLIETGTGTWTYKITDHRLEEVSAVKIDGASTSSYTTDLPNGEITLSVDPAGKPVTANIKGKHDGVKYLERGIDQALDLIKQSNIPTELINDTSFSTAADKNPAETRLRVESKQNISALLAALARDCFLITDFDENGKLAGRTWQPEIPVGAASFEGADFVREPEAKSSINKIYYKVEFSYGQDYADSQSKKVIAASDESEILYQRSKVLKIQSGLVHEEDARYAADLYLFVSRSRNMEVECTLGPSALPLKLGDKIRLTFSRGADPSAKFEEKYFEVIGVEKDLNSFQVRLTLDDMKGLGADLCIITAYDAPNWANSTESQRNSQGYLGDSAGYVDPEKTRKKLIL